MQRIAPPRPVAVPRAPFYFAACLFFLTGALGLGYEFVWIRKSALLVGASQIALSTVLTAFFLGLAAGSYFVGHVWKNRRWSPLMIYGIFEIGVGLFALTFPLIFRLLEGWYGALYPSFSSPLGLFALRFLLLFLLFLIPTFFMGGTLPLMLDALVDRNESLASRTSILYGLNTLGAVFGVLATSYFAIPHLGMDMTSRIGGVGNLLIGAVALSAFRRLSPLHQDTRREPLDWFFPAAAFCSGLLAIAYQVCWTRYFTLWNTTTVYLVSVLLAVYLLALSTGSLILAPLLQARWKPLRVFATAQALVPLVALFTLEWWRLAEYRFAISGMLDHAGQVVAGDTLAIDTGYRYHWRLFGETADAIFFAPVFQTLLVLFLPVLLLGLGLPSLIAASAHESTVLRSVSGRLLFWNTVGSSVGGFISGYLLLPFLGLHWTLLLLASCCLALSLAAIRSRSARERSEVKATRQERRRTAPSTTRRWTWNYALVGLSLLGVLSFGLREDLTASTIKRHGYGREVGYGPEAPPGASGRPALDVVEGPFTSSFVFEDQERIQMGSGNVCLAVAEKKEASTQAIQGHLPCLFYPGSGTPENCMGICLGSGQSFGALLLYPIKTLDIVDISPEIVRLSLRHFQPFNHGLEKDPRVRFHLDDGRHFVARARDASYDVISMEPPPPTAEGVYTLYSFEFYREVSRVLRPGGVFMQWLPLYRVSPLDARGIVKTQAEVFPETFVVKVGLEDFMVISYPRRPDFPLSALRERLRVFETERLVRGMRWNTSCRYDLASIESALALLIMGPEDIRAMKQAMVYHEDNQILSYSSGDRGILRRYEGPALSALSFAALTLSPLSAFRDYFSPSLSPDLMAAVEVERAASLLRFGVSDPRNLASLKQAFEATSDSLRKLEIALEAAAAHDAMLDKESAFRWIEKGIVAFQGEVPKPQIEIARKIIRHAVAVYYTQTDTWLQSIEKFAKLPLVAAMQLELKSHQGLALD